MTVDPNLGQLELAATHLGSLMDELVLVGGCVTGLLITDAGAAPIRATVDVDLVLEAVTYPEYAAFERRLRAHGFAQRGDPDDPICRWHHGALIVDVIPVGGFLGFTNEWYSSAVETKVSATLPSGRSIHHVDAPHFLGTKLAAFKSRGADDAVMSHDAEDVVLVVDGRPQILAEVAAAPVALRTHIADGISMLLDDRLFMDGFEGYFDRTIAAERAKLITGRLSTLANRS